VVWGRDQVPYPSLLIKISDKAPIIEKTCLFPTVPWGLPCHTICPYTYKNISGLFISLAYLSIYLPVSYCIFKIELDASRLNLFFFLYLFICAYIVWAISPPCSPPPSSPRQPTNTPSPHFQAEPVLPFSPILLKSRNEQ
jgi:hypothetical protein